MFKTIIKYKKVNLDEHVVQMKKYESELDSCKKKKEVLYTELMNLHYNNNESLSKTKNKIIYIRESLAIFNQEINFYENYIKYEKENIKELNIEMEKFKHLQNLEDKEKLEKKERGEEEEMLDLLNLTKRKSI